ncbi:MAG: hypothetical protein ACHQZR_07980 [Candidatus Limnocylindrales bacterium]
MRRARRGPLVAATWLIGLGFVFLIRQATDLPWDQLWPLFLIVVGAVGIVSRAFSWPVRAGIWSFTWSLAWIVAGVILLSSTTGTLQRPGELIAEWWPFAAIGLGFWFLLGAFLSGRHGPVETLAMPLEGAPAAAVHLRYGAGLLTVGRAAAGHLVDGTFAGGVELYRHGANRVELRQDTSFGLPWLDHPAEWAVGLTGEVPLDLRVETGASRASLDLGELRVRDLDIRTGASETRVRLPRKAGLTTVHAQAGMASLVLEVPEGVAARIRARITVGSSQIDESRFPRIGDLYQSLDFGTAADRVEIDVQGGVGSVRVTSGGPRPSSASLQPSPTPAA